ncbi:MAG: serine hydrolase domain-containing protein [Acidimicrobiales bacterium]
MKELELDGSPEDVGMDAARLARIGPYFDEFVRSGRLSGWLATVARSNKLVWTGSGGHRDRERSLAVTDDTIWRLFSMAKPITVVAAMMLYEEGHFDLNDDVGRWIEELREPRVYVSGPAMAPVTRPAREPVRVIHLLTHTAGLTYGFQHLTPVDEIYRTKGYDEMLQSYPPGIDLAGAVRDWCSAPLLFEPGSAWNYSVATDVIGRLIEIWSGQRLDEFIEERILGPLSMSDTEWFCPEEKWDRLAMLYVNVSGQALPVAEIASVATRPPAFFAGGGGLVSTARDFQRFMSMLVGGGEVGGVRYLSRRTLALMTKNNLPGGHTLADFALDSFSEVGQTGVGYGLGFSVVADQVSNRSLVSTGSFAWGGAASTYFWVDPAEELAVAFYAQLLPSTSYPIRRGLQQFVYSSLVS